MQSVAVQFEDRACPLGCELGDRKVLEGKDRLHGLPGRFTVVRCPKCGLMRTNPRPTLESIGYYYPADYGPFAGTRVTQIWGDAPQSGLVGVFKQMAKRAIRMNTDVIPNIPPGRMLELGCASGAFLHRMAGKGWTVEGIEPDEGAAQNARALGYQVYTTRIESFVPPTSQQYNLVAAWMVLEHLHEPLIVLQRLAQWVTPDGWLVFSVPNAASVEFRVFKDAWYALQLPTHLYHYTPRTISQLLYRGGWRLEKLFHQRNISNLVASIGYVLRDRGIMGRFAERLINFPEASWRIHQLAYPLAFLLSLFGQTGRMTIWARRVNA